MNIGVAKEVCSACNGEQWLEEVRDGDVISRRCRCLERKMLLEFLGPELARTTHQRSPLFLPGFDVETGKVLGDRTVDNLFIKGTWARVAPHLRWALGGKRHVDPAFSFRMVNDEKVLRVYLGDFAYNRRSAKSRDDIETFNNLSDLVSGLSLVIVRLGQLWYRNKAASAVLLEALHIRGSESAPTWLIEGERYFGEGHPFYSDELGRYIEESFEVIDLGGDVQAAREKETEDVASSDMPSASSDVIESTERFFAGPDDTRDRQKSPNKKRWRGRGGSGGLPGSL